MAEYPKCKDTNTTKILRFWPLASIIVAGAIAWGALNTTVRAQGDKVKENSAAINELLQDSATIKERTKNTADAVKRIENILIEGQKRK